MSRRKVPGSRNYKAESDGFKELGRSAWMSDQSLLAAQRIASAANSAGRSTYTASSRIVPAGRDNEPRAGAVVSEVSRDFYDVRNRVLVQVARSMAVRGGG